MQPLSGPGGNPGVRGVEAPRSPSPPVAYSPARGKSKAERGKSLVGRTVWKTARAVCTHFSNQAREEEAAAAQASARLDTTETTRDWAAWAAARLAEWEEAKAAQECANRPENQAAIKAETDALITARHRSQ